MTAVPASGEDPVLLQHTRLTSAGLLRPADFDAIVQRSLEVGASLPRPGATALQRWSALLDRLQAPPATRRSLDRLAQESALVVVTGQQAGVLTGSSLSILKAVHAIRLARDLEQELERPVAPVFWIASDDHDLGEIHSVHVVNRERQVQRVRLDLAATRQAASEVEVPPEAPNFVRRVFEIAGLEDETLESAVRPAAGERLGVWFGRVLLHLLGEHGLLPVEPSVLLPDGVPLFQRALDEAGGVGEALRRGSDGLRALGLEPPLNTDVETPLFLIESNTRSRIVRDPGGRWTASDRPLPGPVEALVGEGVPRLSPDASLRPALQNATLPVLAYVGGPTELVYWAQLGPLHENLGVSFPPIVPRLSVSLVPRRVVRVLRKRGLELADLLARDEPEKSEPAPAPFERGRQLRLDLESWIEELAELDPSVRTATARRSQQVLRSFDQLLEQSDRSWSDRLQRTLQGDEWIDAYLRPRALEQDRVLSFLPFFSEGGAELIDRLLALDPARRRWIISVTP